MNGAPEQDPRLVRFHRLPRVLRIFYARPRTFVSVALGIATFFALPDSLRLVSRLLIGWDIFITCYLLLTYAMILREGVRHVRRYAIMQDDGRFLILMVTALGAFASLAGIITELNAMHRGAFELTLVITTITLTWATVHTTFALHYAHEYYRNAKPGGLAFPGGDSDGHGPDYWDFVYFAFVIGMTAQVSDVEITDRIIRRTATVHGIISFVFNTALLALMINIAASAI
jgi:uncharacterized membrane protein